MKKQNKNPNTTRKQFGDYIIGKTLGQGTFGKVKLGTHKQTGQNVAIKILQKSKILDVADVERVSREIHILKLIRHPNIVQLYQILETPKQLFLIMEFMQNGELFDYIIKNKRIREQEASKLFHQLIDGIQYIHKIGVAHRDLKPENLLIDHKGSLKIVDFGLSNTYKAKQKLKTPCGSPCYAAPQMIKGQKYDGMRVDIWSCGVILFAMVCGYLPFEDSDTNALYAKILSGKYSIHHTVSTQVRDLITGILNNDQNKRFTIQQIRNHPWMLKTRASSYFTPNIIVGLNKIPIDAKIVDSLQEFNFEADYVAKCLQANRHNNVTTAYYLALKKHMKAGGLSKYDLSSNNFDRTLLQPYKRRQQSKAHKIMMDNFLSRSSQCAEKSRQKDKYKDKQKLKQFKQKRMSSRQRAISRQKINVTTELKQNQTSSKLKPKDLQNSINYGYCRVALSSKSNEKSNSIIYQKRDSVLENRISRKYKQKFNQSLISKSKDKTTGRIRINSSIAYPTQASTKASGPLKRTVDSHNQNLDLSNFMQQYEIKPKKTTSKKTCSVAIKSDDNKILKPRRF